MSNETVRKSGLAGHIRESLEADIDNGVLLPGDALDERMLADRFKVSRTPVREAIQQLAMSGQVEIVPRQGVFVARMSISELRAMFELLAEMEGSCAKLAARRMQDPWRQLMMEALAQCLDLSKGEDVVAYGQANADFHEAIYQGCCNRFLVEQVRMARRRTQSYRRNPFLLAGRMRQSAEDHQRIADAILRGDEEGAHREMIEHIVVGGKGFAEFISTLPESMLASHDMAYPSSRNVR
jgi:Transcriptional regulators